MEDTLKNKKFNYQLSVISLLLENNALIESVADLIIKTSSKNNENYQKELFDFFNIKIEENRENAIKPLLTDEAND
ncbi:MAG: hypothetical protein ACPG3Z_02815 [Saprospiraceae bacterium]